MQARPSAAPSLTLRLPAATRAAAATAGELPPATAVPLPSSTVSPPPFQLCSPLDGWRLEDLPKLISDSYRPPPPGSDDRHQGVDFTYSLFVTGLHSIEGVIVASVLPGWVAASVSDSFPYGDLVIVETPRDWLPADLVERLAIPEGESLYVLYAHLQDKPMAELGQLVAACTPLSRVGKTGNTEAAHLHLETRLGAAGARFPVMSAFMEGTTAEQRANYVRWRTSWEFRHFNPLLLLAPQAIPTPTPRKDY